MKKTILVTWVLVLLSSGAGAQFDTSFAKNRLIVCLDSLSESFLVKDWEKYSRYSNPAMIGAFGGKQEFINYVNSTFSDIPGTAWKKYEPGAVLQILKTEGDLQAMVELHSILELQGMRFISTHHLIAQSWDGGYFWTFFDSQNDAEASRLIKNDLSPLMVIPEKIEKIETIR